MAALASALRAAEARADALAAEVEQRRADVARLTAEVRDKEGLDNVRFMSRHEFFEAVLRIAAEWHKEEVVAGRMTMGEAVARRCAHLGEVLPPEVRNWTVWQHDVLVEAKQSSHPPPSPSHDVYGRPHVPLSAQPLSYRPPTLPW